MSLRASGVDQWRALSGRLGFLKDPFELLPTARKGKDCIEYVHDCELISSCLHSSEN